MKLERGEGGRQENQEPNFGHVKLLTSTNHPRRERDTERRSEYTSWGPGRGLDHRLRLHVWSRPGRWNHRKGELIPLCIKDPRNPKDV